MPFHDSQHDAATAATTTEAAPCPARATDLRGLVAASRLEVLPLKNLSAAASAAPRETTLTITCSPKKGLDVTMRASEELAARGFRVVPHIAARMVRDRDHLDEILSRAARAGITDAFVPGGDAKHALGPYASSLDLLRAMDERGHPFEQIGVAAYPEGHWLIDDDSLIEALRQKQPYATYAVTQMCFSADSLAAHLRRLGDEGIHLPIYAGVAGFVDRIKLATIAVKIGIGQSLRFLKHQGSGAGSLIGTGEYDPTELIEGTLARLDNPARLRGLHIYTFNQVAKTEAWRAEVMAREPA